MNQLSATEVLRQYSEEERRDFQNKVIRCNTALLIAVPGKKKNKSVRSFNEN